MQNVRISRSFFNFHQVCKVIRNILAQFVSKWKMFSACYSIFLCVMMLGVILTRELPVKILYQRKYLIKGWGGWSNIVCSTINIWNSTPSSDPFSKKKSLIKENQILLYFTTSAGVALGGVLLLFIHLEISEFFLVCGNKKF